MSSFAFIIGMLILGLCCVGAAFIISASIAAAAATAKESAPQSLQQPMLSFFTEFDAADYLGISLNELDYMRSEGMLDGTFTAVTSVEQTGEEEYYAMEDGLEVVKLRPVMSPVTRFLFNRQLLDERMLQLIKEGKHINPTRTKGSSKPANKQSKNSKPNNQRSGEGKPNSSQQRSENRNNGQKNGAPKNSETKTERRDDDSTTKIYTGKSRDNNNNGSNNNKQRSEGGAKINKRPSITDGDDDFFSKSAKGEHGRNNSGKPGISYEDDSSDANIENLVSSSYFDD